MVCLPKKCFHLALCERGVATHARVINTPQAAQHSSGYIAPGAMYQSTSLSMNDVILVVSQHPAGYINMENPPVEIIYHHEVLINPILIA